MIRLLREQCGQARTCPRMYRKDQATLIANGPEVTDPADLARVRGDGQSAEEKAIYLPIEFGAEFGVEMGVDDLGAFIDDHFTSDLFRLETLPRYLVDSDEGDYQRYLSGGEGPANNAEWLELLQRDTAAGRHSRRLRIFDDEPTDYERFEAEWCYVPNSRAGEDIRVMQASGTEHPRDLGDFYVVDGEHVLRMNYDSEGRFEGAVQVPAAHSSVYRALAELLWNAAEPFASWWATHPEFRRASRSAA